MVFYELRLMSYQSEEKVSSAMLFTFNNYGDIGLRLYVCDITNGLIQFIVQPVLVKDMFSALRLYLSQCRRPMVNSLTFELVDNILTRKPTIALYKLQNGVFYIYSRLSFPAKCRLSLQPICQCCFKRFRPWSVDLKQQKTQGLNTWSVHFPMQKDQTSQARLVRRQGSNTSS